MLTRRTFLTTIAAAPLARFCKTEPVGIVQRKTFKFSPSGAVSDRVIIFAAVDKAVGDRTTTRKDDFIAVTFRDYKSGIATETVYRGSEQISERQYVYEKPWLADWDKFQNLLNDNLPQGTLG